MKKLVLFFFVLFAVITSVSSQPPVDRWATLDGNKVHYYDIGDAKAKNALVFIHGWSCNADFWKTNYNAFPNYRVIAIDLLGHGKSDAPYLDYTMERFARSVDAVLSNAKVKKAVLVGHSMGMPVARRFYKLFPEKTLAIVDVDMPVLPFAKKEDLKKFAESVTGNYPESTEKFIDGMITQIKENETKAFIRRSMLSTPKHVSVSALNETFGETAWVEDRIDVPVLAIVAKTAMWNPTKEDFVKIAPKVDFQLWTDVSHFLMMERPALFNGQVKGFIMRNKLL